MGGSIAGFLALAGKDVTCIARGKHLKAIREKGLHLKSDLKGEHYLSVKACTAEEYNEQADVIFVCVKGYSINSIQDVLERASHQDTLVIPILNVYGTGPRIGRLVPRVTVLDGCIYIVGFVSGTGEITQMGKIFRLVFGARPEQEIAPGRLEAVANALRDAGIKADISEDINRDTFIGLSRESSEMGRRMGIIFPEDPIEYNLKIIDKLDPQSTASMQKDIAKGHESEIQGMLFDMIELGEKLKVDMPTYRKVEKKFNSCHS